MKRTLVILILLLATAGAHAQPRLELRLLKANTPDYYYYQLYFATFCGDSVIYDLSKRQLILEVQNGLIDTNDYQIDRLASPTRNSCYDIALVFDNSSGVGANLPSVIAAGRAFVDTMGKSCDLASVITFDDRPTIRTFLSSDRDVLREAVDAMAISGRRALYDGISAGITTLYTSGSARVQAVLAFTSGNDNNSGRNLEELIDDVRQYGIRVFIIAMGNGMNETPLRELCTESGGLFTRLSSADELVPAYRRFVGFIEREFDEHRITRRTKDVTMRDLRIRMRLEACDDSVWVQRVFNPFPVVSVTPPASPVTLELGQLYPNPVSRSSELHFRFSLANDATVRLELFDALGRSVAVIREGSLPPGTHTATFRPAALPPGLYLYRLSSHDASLFGRLMITE